MDIRVCAFYTPVAQVGPLAADRKIVSVPDKRIRNIPEVVLVRRWVSWGSGNLEGEGWVRGGTKGVSLQAT
jgi:hypothetical protein